jgi:hypothetical protein
MVNEWDNWKQFLIICRVKKRCAIKRFKKSISRCQSSLIWYGINEKRQEKQDVHA